MRMERTGFEFRMKLGTDKKRVVFELSNLNKISFRVDAGKYYAAHFQRLAVVVIDLVTMPVALGDKFCVIRLEGRSSGLHIANICAKPHRAANPLLTDIRKLFGQGMNNRIFCFGVDFGRSEERRVGKEGRS